MQKTRGDWRCPSRCLRTRSKRSRREATSALARSSTPAAVPTRAMSASASSRFTAFSDSIVGAYPNNFVARSMSCRDTLQTSQISCVRTRSGRRLRSKGPSTWNRLAPVCPELAAASISLLLSWLGSKAIVFRIGTPLTACGGQSESAETPTRSPSIPRDATISVADATSDTIRMVVDCNVVVVKPMTTRPAQVCRQELHLTLLQLKPSSRGGRAADGARTGRTQAPLGAHRVRLARIFETDGRTHLVPRQRGRLREAHARWRSSFPKRPVFWRDFAKLASQRTLKASSNRSCDAGMANADSLTKTRGDSRGQPSPASPPGTGSSMRQLARRGHASLQCTQFAPEPPD